MATENTTSENTTNKSWWKPEFVLVVFMLLVLTVLVGFIIFPNVPQPKLPITDDRYLEESRMYYESTLEYKRNILAIILTAFGAWVGAGAAYFFGRENLRESANSLLHLHRQMTGQDRLKSKTVQDIGPKPLDIILDSNTILKDVLIKFKDQPTRWFVPMQTVDKLVILNEEALYLYLNKSLETLSEAQPTETYANLKSIIEAKTMGVVTQEIQNDVNLKKLTDQYISVKLNENAGEINNKMEESKVFLALVMDDSGKYTHYFTTNDIRKALLKL